MYFEARTSKLEPVNGRDKLGDKKRRSADKRGCNSAGVAFDLYDDDGDCAIATAKCPGKVINFPIKIAIRFIRKQFSKKNI